MAVEFRDVWLERFYEHDVGHRKIPAALSSSLYRKLQILDAASQESDLRVPPGNRFEHLQGNLAGYCSILVNKQYRLIFRWEAGVAHQTHLDPLLTRARGGSSDEKHPAAPADGRRDVDGRVSGADEHRYPHPGRGDGSA
nr:MULTISPECIES: type II toxin-antitoxin system RelE/ParE family toxin [Cobetia]